MSEPTFTEELVFFPCGDFSLAGVLTAPADPNGRAVVIPWGAGSFPSSSRNRVRTRLARSLAERGFHTLRFDNVGVGESEGEYREPNLARPYTEEVVSAVDFMRGRGLARQAIIANCFGSWSTLLAAPQLNGLEGLVIINSPVRRDHKQLQAGEGNISWWITRLRGFQLRSLLRPAKRAQYRGQIAAKASALVGSNGDTRFVDALGYVLDRHVPLLLIYGTGDFTVDFEAELGRGLGVRLQEAGARVEFVDERLQGFATLRAQDLLLEIVVPWLSESPQPASPTD